MVNVAHPALRNKITPTLCSASVRNEFFTQRTLPRFQFEGSHFNRTFVFFRRIPEDTTYSRAVSFNSNLYGVPSSPRFIYLSKRKLILATQ